MSQKIIKRGTVWKVDFVQKNSTPKKLDSILKKIQVLASWGNIGGSLADNSDLSSALNAKVAKNMNLSDLSNASLSRENLGLGSAAIRDVAETGDADANQVVLGSDSRLGWGDSGVQSVSAGDATITIGGTATNPTVKVASNTFDAHGAAGAVQTNLNAETSRAEAAEGAKLAKSANLSDVNDAPTARENLGLGGINAGSRTLSDTTLSGTASQVGGILSFPNPGLPVCGVFWCVANVTRQSPAATTAVNLTLSISIDGGITWIDSPAYTVLMAATVTTATPISIHSWVPLGTPTGEIQAKVTGVIAGSTNGTESVNDGRISGILLPISDFGAP